MILLTGCSQDPLLEHPATAEGEAVEMLLRFGSRDPFGVEVTRQTMPELSDEAKVWNIYLFIFDQNGNKIYGRFFDGAEALGSEAAVVASDHDAWYATIPEGNSQSCSGIIKVKTIARDNCKIFGVTNIDSEMFNISPESFQLIQHQDQLLERVVNLKQLFVERSGFFPMTGELSPVNTAALEGTLEFKRMDAKVRFWIKSGNEDIRSIKIERWQVYNVSADSYLMSREVRQKYGATTSDSAQSYFTSETKNIEVEELYEGGATATTDDDKVRQGFSFYLFENALSPKKSPTNYADRERCIKEEDGTNSEWEYANDNSTYVVLTGHIEMDTSYEIGENESKEGCTLSAEVRYVIHLGDFTHNGADDFRTERNTSYTYTVTINGVNDIRLEVETSNDDQEGITENAPGATGEVTIALHEIFDCDSHYATHVMSFDQRYIKPDNITWYVRTPFSEGRPTNVNGSDVTTGLDFKWVEFRLNTMYNGLYSQNRQRYIPHAAKRDSNGNPYASSDGKTMYVDELVKFLREQKRAYDAGQENLFDEQGLITITAFVNEFYYDEHPFTATAGQQLWKRVVNQDDMRMMHILSDAKTSLDQESMVVGSSYTIQQKSIQTIYNQHHEGLLNAWGTEHFDEYGRMVYNHVGQNETAEYRGNTDDYNGLTNSLKEWGLMSSENQFIEGVRWDKYLNLEATNEQSELWDGTQTTDNYKYLRYSCLTRNRDNDGDGVIDLGEVRWYMASIKQLVGLWVGADGIDNTARMYNRSAADKASDDERLWRQHIISSTTTGNSNNPTLVWAEEGASTGDISGSISWGEQELWEVRCVRNLGMDDSDNADPNERVTDYVILSGTEAQPLFDLEYMNEKSIRYLGQEGMDLVYSDELSAQNRLYWQFEATSNSEEFSSISFRDMQAQLDSSMGSNPYCPEGYRLPNQRELLLMHFYCSSTFWSGVSQCYSRTYYSHGMAGSNPKPTEIDPNDQQKTGWARDANNIYMENSIINPNQRATTARCVRDIER